jgi:hypothetical protein
MPDLQLRNPGLNGGDPPGFRASRPIREHESLSSSGARWQSEAGASRLIFFNEDRFH